MIAAIAILYNPDSGLLDRLIHSVIPQVDKLFVIDNTPGSSLKDGIFFEKYSPFCISYQAFGDNKGIATAQNVGISGAAREGYSHVLLLDQDSALPPDMVEKLLKAEKELITSGKRVAAVGPAFVDEKTGSLAKVIRHKLFLVKRIDVDDSSSCPVEADYIISSGCLIRVSVLREVGGMLEELFIDWVDIEWGLRARHKGYQCYVVPNAVMRHCIGNASVKVLGREVNLHNDIRNYYITRNAAYLLRCKSMGWQWRLVSALKIPQYVVFYSWHSHNRRKSLQLLAQAVWHGFRGRLGRID